jgi:hypothetical protein
MPLYEQCILIGGPNDGDAYPFDGDKLKAIGYKMDRVAVYPGVYCRIGLHHTLNEVPFHVKKYVVNLPSAITRPKS